MSDENPLKGYISKSAIKLTFDDDKKALKLETPGGRIVLLDDNGKVMELKDGKGNRVTLSKKGIVLNSSQNITLDTAKELLLKGANITLKATSILKAEGKGSAELISKGGVAVVQGAQVMIN